MCFWSKGWHLSDFRTLLSISGRTCVLKAYSCVILKMTFHGDTASKVQPAWLGIAQETSKTVHVIQLILQRCQRQGWLQTQPGLSARLQVKPTNLWMMHSQGRPWEAAEFLDTFLDRLCLWPPWICVMVNLNQAREAELPPLQCLYGLYTEIVWRLGSSDTRTSSYFIFAYLIQPSLHEQKTPAK